jgi:hypothetical protein
MPGETVDYYLHTKFHENWTNSLVSSLAYIPLPKHTHTDRRHSKNHFFNSGGIKNLNLKICIKTILSKSPYSIGGEHKNDYFT